jgi:arsenate reductase (glutaredoxin)
MTTIYGLKTCDSCRKAQKALPEARFRDIRTEPLEAGEIAEFLDAFGDALVNRASTTWRGLDDTTRAQPPAALLAAHPTLMKRPVIRTDEALLLAWTPATRKALGVD